MRRSCRCGCWAALPRAFKLLPHLRAGLANKHSTQHRTRLPTCSPSGAFTPSQKSLPSNHPSPSEPNAQAAGYHTVVALDSHTCLQLPRSLLADELAALMMGDADRSSLRFLA